MSRTLPAADISQPPNEVRFLIYDGPEVMVPLEIADFGPGQYILEEQGDQVEISAELLQDLDPRGLWIETELDGQIMGERVELRVVELGITFGSGNHLDMDGNTITNLDTTVTGAGTDAANRAYVDSADITGNAATATQLAADGANCDNGEYPLGVDKFGAVQGCTPDATDDTVSSAELDSVCNQDGKILKRSGGSWACASGGAGSGDNLGDHTASQNLQLGTYWLSGDGGDEGIQVDASGKVSIGLAPGSADLQVGGINGVLFRGTQDTNGTIPIEGPGKRMMWHQGKSAFRAGRVLGTRWDDTNIGGYSVAMGSDTIASGSGSFAIGGSNIASGAYSVAMGFVSIASGQYSLAAGDDTHASGNASFAMGRDSIASGHRSFAMGVETTASGSSSVAMGALTAATANWSTAFGVNTEASADSSTAMGTDTLAFGGASTAMGSGTIAMSYTETAMGRYNTKYDLDTDGAVQWNTGDRLFVIGNGTGSSARSDALVMLKNGFSGFGDSDPLSNVHIASADLSLASGHLENEEFTIEAVDAAIGLYSNGVGGWGSAIQLGEISSAALVNKWAIARTPSPGNKLHFTFGTDKNYAINNTVMKLTSDGNLSIDGTYSSSGADFAEYLAQSDPTEALQPGDIVGVIDGQITRNTVHASQLMVISEKPALVGNTPKDGSDTNGLQAVAFIGQVNVRVWGEVRSGEYILPSGKEDGTGIAVNAERLFERDHPKIVGRAWASSDDPGLKKINVAVGLDQTDGMLAKLIAENRALKIQVTETIAAQQSQIEKLAQQIQILEERGQFASR